ncbi:MAG: hypothetical protein ACYDCP_04940 [Thermoplasmataceae archaeon]
MIETDQEDLERQKYLMDVVDAVKSWKAIRRKKIIAIDVDCESVDNCLFDTCMMKVIIGT